MSSSFGDFQDMAGRVRYVTASQGARNVAICGTDDLDTILKLTVEQAEELRDLLDLHIRWVNGELLSQQGG